MLSQLLRDSVFYIVPRFVSGIIGIVLVPVYSHFLAPAEYGVVDLLALFSSFVYVTIALEVAQGVVIYFAEAQTAEEKSRLASTALWFTGLVYTVFFIAGLVFAQPLSTWLIGKENAVEVFRIALFSIWAYGVYYLTTLFLRWQLRAKQYAVSQIIYTVIYAAASIVLLVVFRLGVAALIWAQAAGYVASGVLAFRYNRGLFRGVFDRKLLAKMLRFSIPLVPSGIGVIADAYVDRFALRALMTLADIGVYGLGLRLANVINFLMYAIQSALTPLILNRQKEPDTPAQLARVFHVFIAFALLLFLWLSLFAPEIFVLFIDPAYWGGTLLIPWLVPATLLSNMHTFAPGTFIAKRTGIFAAINLGGALLNLVLNFLLIPIMGIQGPAAATLVAAIAAFGAHIYFNQRYYPVPYQWKPVLLATLAAVGLYGVGSRVSFSPGAIALKIALMVILLGVVLKLQLVSLDDLRRSWSRIARRRPGVS